MYWHMRFEYTTGLYTLIIYIYRHMRYGNTTRLCTLIIYVLAYERGIKAKQIRAEIQAEIIREQKPYENP